MTLTTCDTSVLLAGLTSWHERHASARAALADVDAVVAHVVMECYSVLTRLPDPHRVRPEHAAAVVGGLDLPVLSLPGESVAPLIGDLSERGVKGGAVYDALVAATALHHGAVLLSSDARARSTYAAVGVELRAVG